MGVVTFSHTRFSASDLYFYLCRYTQKCIKVLFKNHASGAGQGNLPASLWELRWLICLWAGLFVLQIATWDLGLWLLPRTFTLSQLSISERWNFQPRGKDEAHMTILYISLLSCACPCCKVKVAGVLAGEVERLLSSQSSVHSVWHGQESSDLVCLHEKINFSHILEWQHNSGALS